MSYRDRERRDWDEVSYPSSRGGYSAKRYPLTEDRAYMGSSVRDLEPRRYDYDYPLDTDYDPAYRSGYAAPRDEAEYQVVHRPDSVEDRWPTRRYGDDDDVVYERRVREYDPPRRRDEYDYYTDRPRRHRGRHSHGSDDDTAYAHSDDGDPYHRRSLAGGALAGVGAAELARHHNKRQGNSQSSALSRVGKDVGAGTLGALTADAVSRHRSKSRRRSSNRRTESLDRGRDRHEHRHRHHHHDHRSRSSSRSQSHLRRNLAGLGLGAAAVAGAVALARKHSEKGNEKDSNSKSKSRDGRSRSRRRRSGSDSHASEANDDNSHRNKRMAQAGAAGAAAAGLVEHARSKSRSRKGRSRSRLREGVPVAAAGLGSAAVAGLYERHKSKRQEDEEEAETEKSERRRERRHSRSRSRARSRGMSTPAVYPAANNLIEYGKDPVYSQSPAGDYDEEATVNRNGRGERHRSRSRRGSRSQRRGSSPNSSGSDDRRQDRRHKRDGSRSRLRDFATAGLGAAATHAYDKKNGRKKSEKGRHRYDDDRDDDDNDRYRSDYDRGYSSSPYPPGPPGPTNSAPYSQENFYPQTNQFPPPPDQPTAAPPNSRPYYHDPAAYPPPQGAPPPGQAAYSYASPPPADPYGPQSWRGDQNVSAAPQKQTTPSTEQHCMPFEDVRTTDNNVPSTVYADTPALPAGTTPVDTPSSHPPQAHGDTVQSSGQSPPLSPPSKTVQFDLPSSRSMTSLSSRADKHDYDWGY